MPSEQDIQNKIAEDVKRHPIIMYIKGNREMPQCGFSAAVVEIFNELNVSYETVDVLSNPEIREGVKKFTNWPTIPQIFIRGKFIGGCDIIRELYLKGELQGLVK